LLRDTWKPWEQIGSGPNKTITNLDSYMLNSAIKLSACVSIVDLLHLFLSYSVLAKAIVLPIIVMDSKMCAYTIATPHSFS